VRIKIYREFYHGIIYITNEGRHVERLAEEVQLTYYETSALTQDGLKTCFDNGVS
jgi:hypothetical protein